MRRATPGAWRWDAAPPPPKAAGDAADGLLTRLEPARAAALRAPTPGTVGAVVRLGINPIVTFEKHLLNMIENLV